MRWNMGGATLEFIGYGLLVALVLNVFAGSRVWRQSVLVASSLAFLVFFSERLVSFAPMAGFLALAFVCVRLLQARRVQRAFPVILGMGVLVFVWLKKYTFVPSNLYLGFPYVTLGLSYIFFRVLHLIIDAHERTLGRRVSLVSFLNYTLNFTTLISGPIQRYQDFASMEQELEPLPLDVRIAGRSLERVLIGYFKVNVLSLLFSSLKSQAWSALSGSGPFVTRVELGAAVLALYPIYLYCNFSGYIDIVIGLARLLRIELPENFNRPFSADNFLNFWSRWHITLSQWLKTYVYNPLLMTMMRRQVRPGMEPFFGVLAFFVTFFLVGVWHGQSSEFLFFGVLQGGGVSAVKVYQILMTRVLGKKRYRALSNGVLYTALARGLTFCWFALTLLWFWSTWHQLGVLVNSLGVAAMLSLLVVWLGASTALEAWEWIRTTALSWQWQGAPVLTTRYARTVWNTALAVVTVAVLALLNAPAPDIVYKAF